MSDLKIKLFSILNSIGPSMSAQQSEDISEAFNELDRLRAEVASLKEEREVLIDSSNRFSNAQLAAIKQWNLAGEQLFLADETLRSISSYVGQGRMDGVENLDYEDVEKRIKEGIATICQVEESRREALTQQLAAAMRRVERLVAAATPVLRNELDKVEVHPCDYNDDAARARQCTAEVQELLAALSALPQQVKSE